METQSSSVVNWEHVDSLVDRRIDVGKNHIWPFGSSVPIDVRFLVLDRRREIPLHRPDHLEVVVFESGELGYEVENKACVLGKNDVIIVGNHIHHRCLPVCSPGQQPRATVLSFLPEAVHSGVPLNDDLQYLMPFTLQGPTISNVIRSNPSLSQEVQEFSEKIRQALPIETVHSRLAIRTYLKMILLSLTNYCAEDRAASAAFNRQRDVIARLEPAFEYIQKHYDEPIRIADVSRKCAASPCRFMSFFKESTGESFVEYLNRFRVAKAKDLLATTNRTISDIGLDTGFCNQSYFGVVFRRIAGMTPLNYRKQAAGGVGGETLKLQ